MREFKLSMLVIAAASVLAACASTAPVSSMAPTAAGATPTAGSPPNKAAAATTTTTATASDSGEIPFVTPRGFRVETRNGENYYCQRVTRTGSRAKAVENCYSLAEISQMRETSQDFVNRMQSTPGTPPAIDESGGMYNSAVSNPNTQ